AVDGQAEWAEDLLCLLDGCGQVGGVGDVAGDRDGLAARRPDVRPALAQAGSGQVEGGDAGTGLGQPQADRAADSAGRAGHQGGPFVESEAGDGHRWIPSDGALRTAGRWLGRNRNGTT